MDRFEALRKYKELLDSGIITQEEFDSKKKEILNAPEDGSKPDPLMKTAKEKTGDIKETTEKKLEELKQAEEAVKKKLDAEIEAQNAKTAVIDGEEPEIEIPVDVTTEGVIPAGVVQAETSNATKKKFYKQKWFWIVIAALLVFGIFAGISKDDKTADDSAAVAEEQLEEQEQAQEDNTYSGSSGAVTDEAILSVLNSSYEGQGVWKSVGDKHFAFYPEGDTADAFTTLMAYYAQYGEVPSEAKESFDYLCDSIKNLSATVSEAAGDQYALSVLNPANTDKVLMTYMNGIEVYNAFE